jgi:hypothetical protein
LGERFAVPSAGLLAAERVDEHLHAGHVQIGEKTRQQIDHLGIAPGAFVAEDLGAELVKLPVASALRSLRAKHRPRVPPAGHRLFGVHRVLDVRTRRAGRPLRAQREKLAVVLERVHFLFDDVRRLADCANEERRRLDVGRAHFAEAVQAHRARERALDAVPAPDLVGEHVVHALNGAERSHDGAKAGLMTPSAPLGQALLERRTGWLPSDFGGLRPSRCVAPRQNFSGIHPRRALRYSRKP